MFSKTIGLTATFTLTTLSWSWVDKVEFTAPTAPGINGWWFADNLSLTPVPEPSTIIAASLLLLPLGLSAVRKLRPKRVA